MRKINFVLGILFVFGIYQTSIGQAKNQNSSELIEDRFAYSCGVLAGASFEEIGLSKNIIALDEIWNGIEEYMVGRSKVTEASAQKMANAKTTELQGNSDKSKLSKESLSDFYYNYGIVIGANWKTFKVDFKTISQADFNKGLLAILSNTALVTPETAQKEVSFKFKAIKKMEAEDQQAINQAFLKKNQTKPSIITLESGIQYEVLKEGSGKQVSNSPTESITAHYHGTLTNGKVFDSSVDKGKPITFKLTGVINGWQEVLPLMEEGEKIRAYIPPYLAYGNQKRGNIPPNSILIFEIELIKVGQ
jgi:FKBP-type peptidyl-prolyl cis-trans isomerase